MTTWLINTVPWWVWIGLGGGIVGAVFYFFGLRMALAAAAAVLVALVYRQGRKSGYDARARQDADALKDAIAEQKGVANETHGMSDTALDRDNARWLRQ